MSSTADHLPHSGSPQSSPAPLSGRVLSRPHWPWSTYSHRASQSSLSALSTGTTRQEPWDQRPSTGSSSSNTMWQSVSTTARRVTTGVQSASTSQEDLTRHWSFTVCRPRRLIVFRSDARMCPRHLSGLPMMSGSFETLWRAELQTMPSTEGLGQTAMTLGFSESRPHSETESTNLK